MQLCSSSKYFIKENKIKYCNTRVILILLMKKLMRSRKGLSKAAVEFSQTWDQRKSSLLCLHQGASLPGSCTLIHRNHWRAGHLAATWKHARLGFSQSLALVGSVWVTHRTTEIQQHCLRLTRRRIKLWWEQRDVQNICCATPEKFKTK